MPHVERARPLAELRIILQRASLFARTFAELGGRWHGLHWSHEQIPDGATLTLIRRLHCLSPECRDGREAIEDLTLERPKSGRSRTDVPDNCQPTGHPEAHFQQIRQLPRLRISDRYDAGAFTFQTARETVAEGPGGYVVWLPPAQETP